MAAGAALGFPVALAALLLGGAAATGCGERMALDCDSFLAELTLRVDAVDKVATGDVCPWDPSWTTLALTVVLPAGAASLHTLYGTEAAPLSLPPAWQAFAPWQADVGGATTADGGVLPRESWCAVCGCACGYDSWLTIGITTGDGDDQLQSSGIDFAPQWDRGQPQAGWAQNPTTLQGRGISSAAGEVRWRVLSDAPGNDDAQHGGVQVAQITVPTGSEWEAVFNLRGLTAGGEIWEVTDARFAQSGEPVTPTPLPPEPEPEPSSESGEGGSAGPTPSLTAANAARRGAAGLAACALAVLVAGALTQ